jgi:hypothetical protein
MRTRDGRPTHRQPGLSTVVRELKDLTIQIEPPKHLTEDSKRAFSHYITARLPGDWSTADLFTLERVCNLSVLVDQYYRRIGTDVSEDGSDHNLSKYLATYNAYMRGLKQLHLLSIPPPRSDTDASCTMGQRARDARKGGFETGGVGLVQDLEDDRLG